jgi:hypothetical protein
MSNNTPSWLTPPKPTPSNVAKTRPAKPLFRLDLGGKKPTKEEWIDFQSFLKTNPAFRVLVGTAHPTIPNLFFLRYHARYPNGEVWGSKQDLVDLRNGRKAALKRWRQNKAKNDSEWKAERDAKLKQLAERQKIRLAASKEAAEEARYGNSKRAKAYRRRRAEREAKDAEAKAERLRKRREARAKLPKVIP